MSKKQQTMFVDGNLRFTRSGVVWADYVLTGVAYGYRPDEDKVTVRSMHKMLMRSLSREALLLGVCVDLDPYAVARRMIDGVDLDAHPDWERECEASLDTLAEFTPGERVFWLSVPLSSGSVRERAMAAWSAAQVEVTDRLGLPRSAPPADTVASFRRRAELLEQDLPAFFEPKPATAAQMMWLHQHSLERGLSIDPSFPSSRDGVGDRRSAAGFTRARLDEGAQSDRAGKARRIPTLSKVLKVDQPWGQDRPASYQCLLAVAATPPGGSLFPGSEYFSLADDVPGADIDWAIRFFVRTSTEVRKKNQRALTNLNDQFQHRQDEMSYSKGVLDVAASELAEYAAKMEADSMEVEIGSTSIFVTAGPTEEAALEHARALAKLFEDSTYKMDHPMGFQEELWHACTPGMPTPRIVEEFRQITTSTDFSAFVPVVGTRLGDPAGALIALNITTARTGVVLLDAAMRSEFSDVAGSFAMSGNLGSGKSVLFKIIIGSFIDRGGSAIMIDHTDIGEYALFLSTVTNSVVASFSEPEYSLDALRIFGPERGAEITASILIPLLQIQPDERLGIVLTTVLDPEYRRAHDLLDGGLPEILDHLRSGRCTASSIPDDARTLAEKLGVYASKGYAQALFAKDLPPLPIHAPGICIRTHAVKLPSQNEMAHDHLFKQLSLEKRFGRAAYALVTLLARERCFKSPEPSLFALDECHRMLGFEEGLEVATEFLKEGRKANAVLGLASQDAMDGMASETLRGLIETKFGMRQTNKQLARRQLEFLDLDPSDSLVKELTTKTSPVIGEDAKGREIVEPHRRGEGYMRDASGRCGRIKVLLPSDPVRRRAVLTTPAAKGTDTQKSPVRGESFDSAGAGV